MNSAEFFICLLSPIIFFFTYLFFIFLRRNLATNVQDPVLFDSACCVLSVLATSSAYFFITGVADFGDMRSPASNFVETFPVSDGLGCESKTLDVSGGQSQSKVPETASLETKDSKKINLSLAVALSFYITVCFFYFY
mgnify:CR=1 FL=1